MLWWKVYVSQARQSRILVCEECNLEFHVHMSYLKPTLQEAPSGDFNL